MLLWFGVSRKSFFHALLLCTRAAKSVSGLENTDQGQLTTLLWSIPFGSRRVAGLSQKKKSKYMCGELESG